MFRAQWRPAVLMTLVTCVVTGLIYPGIVTVTAQLLFPRQANGSLVIANGRVAGSELIGQTFTRSDYFHSRPSAAGRGYDATASSGTNKGPTDRTLADTLIARAVINEMALDGAERGRIPADLVTASASGLDPDISPASARLQVGRVARARRLAEADVAALVARHTQGRQFRFFGEPRVNVLMLNIALDSLSAARRP